MYRPNCTVDTPIRQERLKELKKKYPQFNDKELLVFIDTVSSNTKGEIPPLKDISDYIENKIFQSIEITYTSVGKETQTYRVEGTHIYNKDGKEVFKEDSRDRNKIFANVAVKQGRAVVVNHRGSDYVVNDKGVIMSTSKSNSGAIMQWGQESGDRKAIIKLAKDKGLKITNEPSQQGQSYVNHSGGAVGSDSYWGSIGEKYGVKSNHYYHGAKTPAGNVAITEEQFNEGKQKVLQANRTLNRRPDRYMDLLARNWVQVKNSDSIFAIGHLKDGIVDGGTGWAVQMAIDAEKPVYVFDQERGEWFKNISGQWSRSDVPILTPNFAGIGTRQLNDAGKRAIEAVYEKTFGQQQSSEPQPFTSESIIGGEIDRNQLDEMSNLSFTSTQQREDRVLLIARLFSNVANRMIEKEGFNGNRKSYLVRNFAKLFELVKTVVDPRMGKDDYQKAEFQKIQDNWQLLVEEAANILFYTEGVGVTLEEKKANDGDENGNTEDNFNDEESIYSHKDGWMLKARELDLRDTLSQETRKVLNTIIKVRRDGKPEVDDLGFPRYLNADYAHLKLLERISKINNSGEFDDALKDLAKRYNWVKQIIKALDGDLKLKAKFYQDLRKEFVPYWIQFEGNTKQVNRDPSIYYMFREWQFNQEQNNTLDSHSLYNAKGELVAENAKYGLERLDKIRQSLNDYEPKDVVKMWTGELRKLLGMVGIDFTTEDIEDSLSLNDNYLNTLISKLNTIFDGVKNGLPENTILVDEYKSAFTEIAKIFNEIPQGATIASFREGGKNYQSYANPSYIGRLLTGLKGKNGVQYLMNNFGKFEWFFKNGQYRTDWFQKLASNKKYRDMIERKTVLHNDGKEFNDWNEREYLTVMLREFFSIPEGTADINEGQAYYYFPLFSDAPSAEFIKFVRYIGSPSKSIESLIIPKLSDVVEQEIDRIDMVYEMEKNNNVKPIAQLGKRGKEFCFFPSFNTNVYTDGRSFLEEYKSKQKESATAARQFIEDEVNKLMASDFIRFVNDSKMQNIGYDETQLKEFYYNNALAYTQIVELTTTDLAYYKNLNDFQKRYKEVYGMTQRLFVGSKYGKPTQNYIILKDIKLKSLVFNNVEQAINKAIEEGRITKLAGDYILSQRAKTMDIADAQALRSLESYRSIMDMSGNWTDEMEQAYNRLQNGTWSVEDFNMMYETIKPFTFTQLDVDSKTSHGNIKVPTQLKTSEYILMAIYNTIAKNVNQSPMLRAINTFMDGKRMDENGNLVDGQKIDFVIFESGVKVGAQGGIQLNENMDFNQVMNELSKAYDNGVANPEIIHTLDTEDYGIQVQSTEHLLDHFEMIGTQFRRLLDSDLPEGSTFNLGGKEYTREEIHTLYQELLTENILDGFQSVSDKFSTIEKVAEALQKEMVGSSRYTDEERKACTLVERNGRKVFNIPLYDPIQSTRIQQLLNSIIKKEVTKQNIRRAGCHQLSSVGLTDELQVRYADSEGHLIYTQKEWNTVYNEGTTKLKDKMPYEHIKYLKELIDSKKFKTYEEYRNSVKSERVAYWECYMGAYSRELVEYLRNDTNGELDISKMPENLRKIIGIRIPTEAKYSMQPLFIKGFLPQNSGAAIMMPADIVTTTGSDFDFDSVYVFLKEFYFDKNAGLRNFYYTKLSQEERNTWEGKEPIMESGLQELGFDAEDSNNGFKNWMVYYKENYPEEYAKLAAQRKLKYTKYDFSKRASEQSRQARNNAILEIAESILTSKYCSDQVDKAGGFDEASRVSAICTVLQTASPKTLIDNFSTSEKKVTLAEAISKLFSLNKDQAKALADKTRGTLNPLSPLTQTYFHSQNANGGKMIGIYAVGNASHASGEWANISLKEAVEIFGKTYQQIDKMFGDDNSTLIADTLAQFLAASVDNVKDPVLKGLNQDPNTGDITNLLARLGLPIIEIGLFLNAPRYASDSKRPLIAFTREDLAKAITWGSSDTLAPEEHKELVTKHLLGKLEDKARVAELQEKSNMSLSDRVLFDDIMKSVTGKREEITVIAQDLTAITQTGRADAMSSAAGPTLGANIARYLKLLDLVEQLKTGSVQSDLLNLDMILNRNSYDIDAIRDESMLMGVPFLQAATKCGVVGALDLMGQLFPHTKENYMKLLLDDVNGLASYISFKHMSVDNLSSLIDKFFNELYLYNMNHTKFFGQTKTSTDAAVNYQETVYGFPDRFQEMVRKYPELRNNSFISHLRYSNKGVKRILFNDSGNMSKQQKAVISNDWAMLLKNPNAEIAEFGLELFKYACVNGLTFDGPQSFIQLAPNVLRASVPDYINSLDEIMETEGMNYQEFVEQFVRNHFNDFRTDLAVGNQNRPIKEVYEDGSIVIEASKVIRKVVDTGQVDNKNKPIFRYYYQKIVSKFDENGRKRYFRLREVDGGVFPAIAKYEPMTALGLPHVFKEYYFGVAKPNTIVSQEVPQYESEMDRALWGSQEDLDNYINSLNNEVSQNEKLIMADDSFYADGNDVEVAVDPATGIEVC